MKHGARLAVALLAGALSSSCFSDADVVWTWPFTPDAPGLTGVSARTGDVVTLAAARGDVVAVTFGYGQCVDLCPLTLRKLDAMLRDLGDDADRVRAEYVTIDPARDSLAVLHDVVTAHDRRIDGLRIADEAALAATTRDWGVIAAKHGASLLRTVSASPSSSDYSFEHTATIFLVDANGKLRAKLNHAAAPETMADAARRLVREAPPALDDTRGAARSDDGDTQHGALADHSDTARDIAAGHAAARGAALRAIDVVAHVAATGSGAAYFTIVNDGEADRLLSVRSPRASRASIHVTVADGDVVSMREVDGLDVPAHGRLVLAPGHAHVMLAGVARPDNEHGPEALPLDLSFANAGLLHVDAEVQR